MTERTSGLTDEQIGERLTELGDLISWPPTPDLAGAVSATIRDERGAPTLIAPRLSLPSRRRTLLLIAAALLALAGAALATRLVIELGAVGVEVLPGRPTSLPPHVAKPGDLGREIDVSDADVIAGFPAALPAALGPPARAWIDTAQVDPESNATATRVVTAWRPTAELTEIPGTGVGAVLMQFEGPWQVASKLLSAETNRFGIVFVNGRDAFWTTGTHELQLVSGSTVQRHLVNGNVVIWEEAGFTFRLESLLGKRAAIRLAETVQPLIDLG
ncbi:MAG: hypothetical protein OEV60_00160 [Actinomycetota bacterium]|nr:hypothetical protein [Actinomycetota bacterium]MDH5312300.1 hypothetical protein [Actinomycetota bacterium]